MSLALHSPSWYRVADLKLALRGHVEIQRQSFRGRRWYVVRDHASGRLHRFTPSAYLLICLLDGKRTVEEVWRIASDRLGEDALTQDEMIQLLVQLHQGDLLRGNVGPDMREMTTRAERQARRKLLQMVLNPLALRLPLLDPDRFLGATLPLVRPLLSWFGVLLFLLVVGLALLLAGVHWSALTTNVADRVLATESILLLIATYPFVKALHELGHGYVAKHYGGEVHEIGLMFLVFIPVPYVDASSVASFPDKWRRALVGAAGMMVELFLAALAMLLWVSVEEGIVKAFAFNVMLIGGVSTVLFNGNPLLRFDGYYVLSDLIEIPNLGVRANRYIGYLFQRHLFGARQVVSPANAPGEARWFLCYGIASFAYRIFISITIIAFVASEFFVIGVILGIWAGFLMFGWPLVKSIRFVLTSPVLARQRRRACATSAALVAGVLLVALLVPVPSATVAQGVVWADRETVVHAGTDGVVAQLLVEPNAFVDKGQALFVLEDPLLPARVRLARAELAELRLRSDALEVLDQAAARVVAEQLRHAEAELELTLERQREMTVRSPVAGRLLLPLAQDLLGTFVDKGDAIGQVATLEDPVVRVVVHHRDIDLVRDASRDIRLRFADRFAEVREARIVRELPFVTNQLPSLALARSGGGRIYVDPSDQSGATALETFYQVELQPEEPIQAGGIGVRVFVRFGHEGRPLGTQLFRWLRQQFLRQFGV